VQSSYDGQLTQRPSTKGAAMIGDELTAREMLCDAFGKYLAQHSATLLDILCRDACSGSDILKVRVFREQDLCMWM